MLELTPDRLAELRRIAAAATPGPWAVNPWQAVVDEMETLTPICGMLWPTELRTEEQTLANAQHIAAFDPTTALELLDALAAARAEAERWKQQYEALRAGVERVVQDLSKRAYSCAQDWQKSGHPYHDGASDAYYEAEQIVRRVLGEEGGGTRG